MNIDNLNRSITEMSDQELLEHIRLLRTARRTLPPRESKPAKQKAARLTVDAAPKALDISSMSRDQMLALLSSLQAKMPVQSSEGESE